MVLQQTDNEEIAGQLEEVAELLELQRANPFRVQAYRRAAERIRALETPVAAIYDRRGVEGLQSLETIGDSLSSAIVEILQTGRLGLLARLRTQLSPVDVFVQLPGVGPTLARRIVDELDIETLEELERAVHDGRLQTVPGIGAARAEGIGHGLAGMIDRGVRMRTRRRIAGDGGEKPAEPPVSLLLALDAEYRKKARAGELRRIAPRRFNPDEEKWLPVMETTQGDRRFTVLFSNTRRAHELGRTHDWVVIYVGDGDGPQYTVVTARSGPLKDKRVVRGREAECGAYYRRRRRAMESRYL